MMFAGPGHASDLQQVVDELVWSSPVEPASYKHTKVLDENLYMAVDAISHFDPVLALKHVTRCQHDAARKHDVDLARICAAVGSASADMAGSPQLGLYWAGRAGKINGSSSPVFEGLDGYVRANMEAIEPYANEEPGLTQSKIKAPVVEFLKMNLVAVSMDRGTRNSIKLYAVGVRGNGQTINFFLDTGAPSFVSSDAATRLGFSGSGPKVLMNTLDGCNAYLEHGELATLHVGVASISGLPIWRSESSCPDYSAVNVLGYDFLYRYGRVFVDYGRGRVALGRSLSLQDVSMPGAVCEKMGFRFSPLLVEGSIAVVGSIGDMKVSVLPDLGNSIAPIISHSVYKRMLSMGMIEGMHSQDGKVVTSISLGGETFPLKALIRNTPMGLDVVLPYNFFKKWFFDYTNGLVCGSR